VKRYELGRSDRMEKNGAMLVLGRNDESVIESDGGEIIYADAF
jgi:hypothetical protein